jgi:hypothetical protein
MKREFVIGMSLALIAFIVLMVTRSNHDQLEWTDEERFRYALLDPIGSGQNGLSLISGDQTNIVFRNELTTEEIEGNRFLLSGSGVAIGDVDADGLADIYFCRLNGENVLYKNLGNWEFKDITQEASLNDVERYSTGTVFADLDGDTDLDLLVTALGGPNSYYRNDGEGVFTDITAEGGLESSKGSTSMALADIEGDGDLDLYVTNFKVNSVESILSPFERRQANITEREGQKFIVKPEFAEHYRVDLRGDEPVLIEKAELDVLYINDGIGRFTAFSVDTDRFTDENGNNISELFDWGLQVRFHDFDNDGDPDIYVCNDYGSPDRIWRNNSRGFFQPVGFKSIRHKQVHYVSRFFRYRSRWRRGFHVGGYAGSRSRKNVDAREYC